MNDRLIALFQLTLLSRSPVIGAWWEELEARNSARGTPRPSGVDAFYWTVPAPDIINPGREEQGSVSV